MDSNDIDMADNYLEKQYEAYAARKAAWEKAKKLGKLKKKKNRNRVWSRNRRTKFQPAPTSKRVSFPVRTNRKVLPKPDSQTDRQLSARRNATKQTY